MSLNELTETMKGSDARAADVTATKVTELQRETKKRWLARLTFDGLNTSHCTKLKRSTHNN